MNLSIEGAHTFSRWEKVAAIGCRLRRPSQATSYWRPHEGLPSPSSAAVPSAASYPTSSCMAATPHPPPPAAPSPNGRGFARPDVGVPFQQERSQPLTRRPQEMGWARSFEAREWGSRRLRPSDIGRPTYFLDNPIKPFLHFVVGEAKLDEAMPLDQVPACLISFNPIEMMFAVHFDRQSEIMTTKVSDKSGDRHLSAKFQSIEPAVAKLLPKNIFGRRAPGTQTSCNRDQFFSHAFQFAHRDRRSQPLTRHLRWHPLPLGEGWARSEVKR
jgi:hypothetical protein